MASALKGMRWPLPHVTVRVQAAYVPYGMLCELDPTQRVMRCNHTHLSFILTLLRFFYLVNLYNTTPVCFVFFLDCHFFTLIRLRRLGLDVFRKLESL